MYRGRSLKIGQRGPRQVLRSSRQPMSIGIPKIFRRSRIPQSRNSRQKNSKLTRGGFLKWPEPNHTRKYDPMGGWPKETELIEESQKQGVDGITNHYRYRMLKEKKMDYSGRFKVSNRAALKVFDEDENLSHRFVLRQAGSMKDCGGVWSQKLKKVLRINPKILSTSYITGQTGPKPEYSVSVRCYPKGNSDYRNDIIFTKEIRSLEIELKNITMLQLQNSRNHQVLVHYKKDSKEWVAQLLFPLAYHATHLVLRFIQLWLPKVENGRTISAFRKIIEVKAAEMDIKPLAPLSNLNSKLVFAPIDDYTNNFSFQHMPGVLSLEK